ncbi:hypothetical protein LXL04_009019 [Taraxacum kok-saghyz]
MQHLPIHFPYEARIGGPVQNRWMYQFERFLNQLKKDVKNKSKVEGSIVNAYLLREAANFCSYYFEPNVLTRNRNVPRNDDGGDDRGDDDNEILKIFSHPGRAYGNLKKRMLTDDEFNAVHTYILLKEDQMQPYIEEYEKLLEDLYPHINGHDLAVEVDKHFATWFENHAREKEIKNKYIYDLSRRALRSVKSYKVYFVNGYKFHTDAHKVEYPGFPRKSTFVFKCDWYDPTDNVGVKVKPRGWTDVGESDHQKDVAFQEDEVVASEIISNTTEAFDGDDGIADSESSFEYSTSDNEEEVEEEDECDDSD